MMKVGQGFSLANFLFEANWQKKRELLVTGLDYWTHIFLVFYTFCGYICYGFENQRPSGSCKS